TPRVTVRLLREIARSNVASAYWVCLPILGVDGSLAHTGLELAARGRAVAKTGTTVSDGALKAQNLAGYIDSKSGRQLAFALFVNDAGPISSLDDVSDVFEDEAAIVNAIYELT